MRRISKAQAATARVHSARRLSALPIDPLAAVLSGALGDDPAHLQRHVAWLAERKRAPEALSVLERIVVPTKTGGFQYRRLIETLRTCSLPAIRIHRVATDLGVVKRQYSTRYLGFCISDVIEATRGKKARQARLALHALGHVECATGWIELADTSDDAPKIWPSAHQERAATLLHLIVTGWPHGLTLVRPDAC